MNMGMNGEDAFLVSHVHRDDAGNWPLVEPTEAHLEDLRSDYEGTPMAMPDTHSMKPRQAALNCL